MSSGLKLKTDQFESVEFVQTTFLATPGVGVEYEQIFDQLYWGNVANRMQAGSIIRVIPEDQTYFAELLVRDCGSTWAKVTELWKKELDPVEVTGDDGANGKYKPEYRGLRTKWCVILKADESVVVDKLGSKTEALSWISANARAFAPVR